MKTILLTLALLVSARAAFGQGKIHIVNDAAHAVIWGGADVLKPADVGLADTAAYGSPTPSDATLLVDLYGGPDADSMTFQWTVTISAAAGLLNGNSFISTNLPGGVTATMQVKVRESTFPTAEAAQANGGYCGFSQIFTFKPSSTIAYNSIINPGGTTLSTWVGGVVVALGNGTPGLPIIYAQPTSGSYVVGTNATLDVGAVGAATLGYQWRKDGNALTDATNATLSLTDLGISNAGNYDVVVTNFLGSITSIVAVVQVLPPNAPSIQVNNQLAVGTVNVTGSANISITGGFPGGIIFYTLDGSTPTVGSTLYTGSFSVTDSRLLRAMSLSSDFSRSSEAPSVNIVILPAYALSTSVSGNGVIDRSPNASFYASNSVVALTAIPSVNWAFDHWTGDLAGNSNPASITMNGPRNVQAVFVPTALPLTLSTAGGGSVTANGQAIGANTYYPTGSVVQLQATPDSGWAFLNWQGTAISPANPFGLLMNQTQNVQAVFGTVVTTNIAGNGSVLMSAINPVPFGTLLTNTAVPAPGYRFVAWGGAVSGTNNPVTFTVTTASPTVSALFAALPATGGQLKNPRKIGSDFVCDLEGTPSRNYQIRYSTNLMDWADLLVLANVTGTVSFTNTMDNTSRYYRAMLSP